MNNSKNILHILEKEAKPEGLSREAMEELRELFGTELTFVEAVNMIAAAIRNKDTAEAVNEAAENNKKPEPLIFYDVKGVAELLGCSIPTAREIMHRADFPSKKIANTMRVSRPALEQWSMMKG